MYVKKERDRQKEPNFNFLLFITFLLLIISCKEDCSEKATYINSNLPSIVSDTKFIAYNKKDENKYLEQFEVLPYECIDTNVVMFEGEVFEKKIIMFKPYAKFNLFNDTIYIKYVYNAHSEEKLHPYKDISNEKFVLIRCLKFQDISAICLPNDSIGLAIMVSCYFRVHQTIKIPYEDVKSKIIIFEPTPKECYVYDCR